jgi:protease PrsW
VPDNRTQLIAAAAPQSQAARYALGFSCLLLVAIFGSFMALCIGLSTLDELFQDPAIALVSMFNAVALAVPYAGVIYWLDRNEKEPWWLLTSAFLWGAVMATGLSMIFNDLFGIFAWGITGSQLVAGQLTASFSAPFVEEATKGLALFLLYGFFRKEFDNVLDGVVYGAFVGLGFAVFENFLYYARMETMTDVFLLTIIRGVLASAGSHACFTAMTGASLGWFRVLRRGPVRWLIPPIGLGLAMFAHFAWNTFAQLFSIPFGSADLVTTIMSMPFAMVFLQLPFILLVLLVSALALRHERHLIEKYLSTERPPVVLEGEISRLVPARRRTFHAFKLLATLQVGAWLLARRRNQRLVQLAFEKWHMDREAEDGFAEARQHAVRVKRLRSELSDLQPST